MRILIGIFAFSLSLMAQTRTPANQLKAPGPTALPVGLMLIMSDNSIVPITINPAMFQIVAVGVNKYELRVVASSTSATTSWANVKLVQQSDGNYAPATTFSGAVVPASIEVHRNGSLLDDSDYAVVDTSKVLISFKPPSGGGAWDPTDKLSVRFQTR